MRVLQINAAINKGSTGIIARDICKTIIGYGGEVFLRLRKKHRQIMSSPLVNR